MGSKNYNQLWLQKMSTNVLLALKAIHKEIKFKFKCDHCDKEFRQISDRRRHVKSVHEKIKYPCTLCDFQATQKSYLTEHKQLVHLGIKYECTICGQKASTQSNLSSHTRSKHSEREYYRVSTEG